MNSYPNGATIRFSAVLRLNGVLTDPATLTFKTYEAADGTITSHVYGTDATLIKDDVGLYHINAALSKSGAVVYRWVATGTPAGVAENSLTILPDYF
jgi:hypothetical protein